ncbi:response regulator [Salinibaculum salinum]|uniref:response regulator n=1 Tax=Salinibaculum salinum TaxID=3131996 RepID=UPI0030ED9D4E
MSKHTVLLADDNSHLREIFVQQLREHSRVRGVGTGDALLEALDQSVDAVVCDWKLNGTQKTDLLNAIGQTADELGIVVMSGSLPSRDLRPHGVDECLEKPFKTDTLRDAINSAIEEGEDAAATHVQPPVQ